MAFMDNYEGNKERTDRWLATFPQGRLEAHIIEFNDMGLNAALWVSYNPTIVAILVAFIVVHKSHYLAFRSADTAWRATALPRV